MRNKSNAFIGVILFLLNVVSFAAQARVDESKMQIMVEPDYKVVQENNMYEGLYNLYKTQKPTAADQKEWALMADNLTGYMLQTPLSQTAKATRRPRYPEADQTVIIARYSPASSSTVPGGHLGRIDVHQLVRDLQGNMQSVVFPYRTTAGERYTRAEVTAKNADGSIAGSAKMYFNGRDPVIDAAKGIGPGLGGTGDTKVWHNLSLEGFLTYVGMAQREYGAMYSLVAVPKLIPEDWTSCSGFLCSEKTYHLRHWLQPEWYIGYATGVRTDGMFPMICLNGDKACGNDSNSLLLGGVQFVKAESGTLPYDDPVMGMTNLEMSDLPNFQAAISHDRKKGLGFIAMLAMVVIVVVAVVATGGALAGAALTMAQAGSVAMWTAIAYSGITFVTSGGNLSAMLANEGQNGLLGDVSDGRLAASMFSGGFGDPTDNIRDGFILPNIFDKSGAGGMQGINACRGNTNGYPAGCDFMLGAFQGQCDRSQRNFECPSGLNQNNGIMFRADGYQETNLTRINKYLEGKMTIKFKDPTEYDGIRGNLYQWEKMQNRVKKYQNVTVVPQPTPKIEKERVIVPPSGAQLTGQNPPDPIATGWAAGRKCTELPGSYSPMSPEGKAKVQRITGCSP